MKSHSLSVLSLLIVGLIGCGPAEKTLPTYEVKGKVVQGGQPVAHATVVFHPKFELGPDVSKPRGTTKEDGTFSLSTYAANDGAPEGEYLVTVELWTSTNPEKGPESRLAPKYAKPDTSGLKAQVTAGKNEIPAIEL